MIGPVPMRLNGPQWPNGPPSTAESPCAALHWLADLWLVGCAAGAVRPRPGPVGRIPSRHCRTPRLGDRDGRRSRRSRSLGLVGPVRQWPGLGTVSNAVLIGLAMNWSLAMLPHGAPLAW